MKRRIITWLVALSLLLTLAACGGTTTTTQPATQPPTQGAETQAPATTPDGTDAEKPDETDGADSIDKYPADTLQLIVPVKPGGDTDMNARMFSKYLEKELGVSIAVVNVDGASGTIGMNKVKSENPDGRTALFFHTEAMLTEIAELIDYKLDAFDMAGICIVDNTTVLATHKDAPYKTLKEMVDYAKEHPGQVEFGMATGGYPHLIGLALETITDTDLNLVDIGGNAPKTTALLGAKTDVINTQYGLNKQYFDSGDFINLGLCSKERNPLMPDLETTTEQGYEMDFNKFFFIALPKGTPKATLNFFSDAMKRACENPEFIEEAGKSFLTSKYMAPEDAMKYAEDVYQNLVQYKDLFIS